MEVRAISGAIPHPSRGTWEEFLDNECEVRDTYFGTTHFGSCNCNYILFPNGDLVENYGFWGKSLMADIRRNGWQFVLSSITESLIDTRILLESARCYQH